MPLTVHVANRFLGAGYSHGHEANEAFQPTPRTARLIPGPEWPANSDFAHTMVDSPAEQAFQP